MTPIRPPDSSSANDRPPALNALGLGSEGFEDMSQFTGFQENSWHFDQDPVFEVAQQSLIQQQQMQNLYEDRQTHYNYTSPSTENWATGPYYCGTATHGSEQREQYNPSTNASSLGVGNSLGFGNFGDPSGSGNLLNFGDSSNSRNPLGFGLPLGFDNPSSIIDSSAFDDTLGFGNLRRELQLDANQRCSSQLPDDRRQENYGGRAAFPEDTIGGEVVHIPANRRALMNRLAEKKKAISLDDFALYQEERQGKDSNREDDDTPGPIPERLCYIFPHEARGPKVPLPQHLSNEDCTSRMVAAWLQSGYKLSAIASRVDVIPKARGLNRPKDKHERKYGGLPRTNLDTFKNLLSVRAQSWRWLNGPLAEKIGARGKGLAEKYLCSLLQLSNAQLFFRVIGDLVTEGFTSGSFEMTPPWDRYQRTDGDPTVRYPLPAPKEIHPVIRKAFVAKGRLLPTLKEFLQRHPEISNYFFPDGNMPREQEDEKAVLVLLEEKAVLVLLEEKATKNAAFLLQDEKAASLKRKRSTSEPEQRQVVDPAHHGNTPQCVPANTALPLPNMLPSYYQANSQEMIGQAELNRIDDFLNPQNEFRSQPISTLPNILDFVATLDVAEPDMREQTTTATMSTTAPVQHPHSDLITQLVELGYYDEQIVKTVEAASRNKAIAIEDLARSLPNSEHRAGSSLQATLGFRTGLPSQTSGSLHPYELDNLALNLTPAAPEDVLKDSPAPFGPLPTALDAANTGVITTSGYLPLAELWEPPKDGDGYEFDLNDWL
jgi:hypothetical protein